MVISTRLEEWCSRLFELHRLTQQEPEGPTWLWRIRIKILTYLVARYADESVAKTPRAKAAARRIASTPTDMVRDLDRPLPNPRKPPRSPQVIRPVLDELQVLNDERRNDEGFYPEPAVLWEWWRETWCTRQ